MPSQYIDRGFIKWAPFNALNGYYSILDEMKNRLRKLDKPILSDDEYDDLNRNIQEALIKQSEIEINYYENGYVKTVYGHLKKMDFVNRLIVLSTDEKIPAIDVLGITIL